MSTPEAEQEPETRVTRTRSQKMSSSPEKIAPAESQTTVAGKKESFQWSTPADEFADDVGSDIEDIGDEIEHYDVDDSISDSNTRTEIDKETGGIIISLGSDEANKYSVSSDDSKAGISPQKKQKKVRNFICHISCHSDYLLTFQHNECLKPSNLEAGNLPIISLTCSASLK